MHGANRLPDNDPVDAGYVIRRAVVTDAPIIARHRVLMFRDMGEPAEAEAALEENSREQLRRLIERDEYLGWLAERDGVVVAGVGVFLRRLLPRFRNLSGRPEAYLLNVYTDPAHRRRGVARALIEGVIEWCRAHDVCRVTLHASQEGWPLYEGLGFAPVVELRRVLVTDHV